MRQRLGSGSYITINGHLGDWRKEHAGQVPAMPDKVMGAFQQAWATDARVTQEDVETEPQALEAMRREMQQDKADMATEIEQLDRERPA